MSNSLRSHGPQHTRLLCPSLFPRHCSNSCPLSQWCYLTVSSFAGPFSFCLHSFPATGSFPMSWLSTSGVQSLSFSIRPFKIYSGLISFRIDLLAFFAVQGTLKESSPALQFETFIQWITTITLKQFNRFFGAQPSLWSNSHIYTRLQEKPLFWLYWSLSAKWCLCF